jgi:hypothetical protein
MIKQKNRIVLILALGFISVFFLIYWIYGRVQAGKHFHYNGLVKEIQSFSDGIYHAEIEFLANPPGVSPLNSKYNGYQNSFNCVGYKSLQKGDKVLIHIIPYSDGTIVRKCSANE